MTYETFEGFNESILQLDDDSIRLRKLAAINAALFRYALISSELRARLDTPEVGDFVYEDTALYTIDLGHVAAGIGIYQGSRIEPELIDDEADPPEFVDVTFYYVRYGPDESDVARWSNTNFHVIPTSMQFKGYTR